MIGGRAPLDHQDGTSGGVKRLASKLREHLALGCRDPVHHIQEVLGARRITRLLRAQMFERDLGQCLWTVSPDEAVRFDRSLVGVAHETLRNRVTIGVVENFRRRKTETADTRDISTRLQSSLQTPRAELGCELFA